MVKKCILRLLLLQSFIAPFQVLFSVQVPKIVTLSETDVISIRKDIEIAKKIIAFLWKKSGQSSYVLFGPLLKLLFDKKISIEQLIKVYPVLAPYKNKLYKLVTLEDSIHGILDILIELKKQGVMLVLAADAAQDSIEYKKRKKPEIFNLFDQILPQGTKTDVKFYATMRQRINELASITHATEILFVDSDKGHTDTALKADQNIRPHLFVDATDFKQELIKKGYLSTLVA